MANQEDKIKTTSHDMSEMNGVKPFGNIGSEKAAGSVVEKLKKNKEKKLVADGSTTKSGEDANVGTQVTKSIGDFVGRK